MVCEHEYMNMCPPPIIALATALKWTRLLTRYAREGLRKFFHNIVILCCIMMKLRIFEKNSSTCAFAVTLPCNLNIL
jgi:hypothetical protein